MVWINFDDESMTRPSFEEQRECTLYTFYFFHDEKALAPPCLCFYLSLSLTKVHGSGVLVCRRTATLMLMGLFEQLRSYFISYTRGSEQCLIFFLVCGSAVTLSVERSYTADGIQMVHMLLWRAEGPKMFCRGSTTCW